MRSRELGLEMTIMVSLGRDDKDLWICDGFPKGNQHAGNCLDVKDKGVGGQTDPWVSASADQVDGCAIW